MISLHVCIRHYYINIKFVIVTINYYLLYINNIIEEYSISRILKNIIYQIFRPKLHLFEYNGRYKILIP